MYSFPADLRLSRNKTSYVRKLNKKFCMQCKIFSAFLKCTQWNWFYTASTENPLINPFIHLGNIFQGKNVFLITRILAQSDSVINSSMQQPWKLLPVIYCATYLEPALLVDGLVCYFITHFLKDIRENQKPWKSTRALLIACHWQLHVKENKSSNKDLSWNNSFQITRESLHLIYQFLTFNS